MRCRSLSGWTKGLRVRTSRRRSYGRRSMGMDKGWAAGLAGVIGSLVWIGLLGRREQLALAAPAHGPPTVKDGRLDVGEEFARLAAPLATGARLRAMSSRWRGRRRR